MVAVIRLKYEKAYYEILKPLVCYVRSLKDFIKFAVLKLIVHRTHNLALLAPTVERQENLQMNGRRNESMPAF